MTSATFAAYKRDPTLNGPADIVRDTSIPFRWRPSRLRRRSKGLGDGLWAWYGADIAKINPLLTAPESSRSSKARDADAGARISRGFSLLLALRAPHVYLVEDPQALSKQTDRYLRALAERGIISRTAARPGLEQKH